MGELLDRVDRWQRAHSPAAFGFAVFRKFSQDGASNLAALISYYSFFSIFPLLLAGVTVLGYITDGNQGLYRKVFCSAVGSFPILNSAGAGHSGDQQIQCPNSTVTLSVHALSGSPIALVVGLVLAIYSGLGVAKTAQSALNRVYDVPQGDRPNFFSSIGRALVLIVTVGLGLIVATFVGTAASSAGRLGLSFVGPGLRVVSVIASLAVLAVVFDVAFNWLTVHRTSWRSVLPGAVVAAVGYEIVSQVATAFIAHKASSSQATYGTFATVIAMLSWFYLTAQIVLIAAEVNVVRERRLWPRSLHGDPDTAADQRAMELAVRRDRLDKVPSG